MGLAREVLVLKTATEGQASAGIGRPAMPTASACCTPMPIGRQWLQSPYGLAETLGLVLVMVPAWALLGALASKAFV